MARIRDSSTARLDRDVSIEDFAPGNAIVLTANDGTRRRLFRVDENGTVATYPLGDANAAGGERRARRNDRVSADIRPSIRAKL